MSPLDIINSPNVSLIDGKAVTNSRDVAEFFSRDHKNVLKAINALVADVAELNFEPCHFAECQYRDGNGRYRKSYNMTRDGFTLLAMGFTGKKALKFKLAYIDAFNAMDEALKEKSEVRSRKSEVHPAPAGPPQLPPKPRTAPNGGLEDYALNQLQQQFALGRVDVEAKVQLCSIMAADRVAELFRSLLLSVADPQYTPRRNAD